MKGIIFYYCPEQILEAEMLSGGCANGPVNIKSFRHRRLLGKDILVPALSV